MEGTQEGQTSYLSGDVSVDCVRLMPVSLTAARGPGTACTGAQRELAQVEPLGAQQSQERSQPHSPSQNQIQFTCLLCPREKTYLGTASSVTAHQREAHPGEGNSPLEKIGRLLQKTRRSNRCGVCYRCGDLYTRTSADTRVGAIKHPQIPYPRILMDWVVSSLRETQTRPRPLQRKLPIIVNSLHQANFCRGNRRCVTHAGCSRRNNPCQDVSLHGKSGSTGVPNVLCQQPEACPTHFL